MRWVVELIETLALTLVIFLVIQNLVAQPYSVHQTSMQHTLEPGQYVLIDRLSHFWSPYARGEIIVFQPPVPIDNENDPLIKRVIGVAGDRIEIRDGQVYVNDRQLDEPYLYKNDAGVPGPTLALGDTSRWVVPEGEVFAMGDHREVSEDSRAFGPIPITSIVGRAVLRYWPPSAFGPVERATYAP